jgi:hypothetical protein
MKISNWRIFFAASVPYCSSVTSLKKIVLFEWGHSKMGSGSIPLWGVLSLGAGEAKFCNFFTLNFHSPLQKCGYAVVEQHFFKKLQIMQ